MYQVTVTYGQHSSTLSSKPTLAQACDELTYLYDFYINKDGKLNAKIGHCEPQYLAD